MRTLALAKRLVKQVGRDHRTVALMFVAPLLILLLLDLVFTGAEAKPVLDTVTAPAPVVEQLKKAGATVRAVSLERARADLAYKAADAFVAFSPGGVEIRLEGSDPLISRAALQTVQKAMQATAPSPVPVRITYLHGGPDFTALDYDAPVLVAFFVFFFVFLIAGVQFLRERTAGTLERVLATPLRRHEIVLGYFLGFGLFALAQTLVIQWFVLDVMKIRTVGGFWSAFPVSLLAATVALALGTLLSAFARNEFQMMQFIPLVILPQVFLSGLFELRGLPAWLQQLGEAFPLTHAARALRGVMVEGRSLDQVQAELWILAGYCVAFLALNVVALRRHRRV